MRLINFVRVFDEFTNTVIYQGDDLVYFGGIDEVPEHLYGEIIKKAEIGDDCDLIIDLREEEEETIEDILDSFGC